MLAEERGCSRHIDHHDAEFAQNYNQIFRDVRGSCPIARSDAHGGFTILTRYADNRAALRDAASFASGRVQMPNGKLGGGVAIPPNGVRIGMIEMDGPEASRFRAILNPWFTVAAIEAARPRIAEISRWLVDSLIEAGSADVVDDLAKPMPSILIMDVLGLPLGRWRDYGTVLHEAVVQSKGSIAGLQWLSQDLVRSVEQRDYDPEGLFAALLSARIDGASLTTAVACEMTLMLLFGAADTTVAAIGHGMRLLTERPDIRQSLIDRPELIPAAVEEILRFYSPSTGPARNVVAQTEIGGHEFAVGERVMCAIGSANRDPDVFANPDRFDLHRPKRPHLAFGWGIHACLGQNLARADLAIFFAEVLSRMPDFQVDLENTQRYKSIPLVNGHSRMPFTFTPGICMAGEATAQPVLTAPRLRPVA